MKTRYWIIFICGLLILCLGLSAWLLLPGKAATHAQVYSEGQLLYTLDLSVDRVVTVTTPEGTNVIQVRDGAVAVTYADCPDGYCVKRGFCRSGTQIVCLPHRLQIRFVGMDQVDGAAG